MPQHSGQEYSHHYEEEPLANSASSIEIPYLGDVVSKWQKELHLASPRCGKAQRTVPMPGSEWKGLTREGIVIPLDRWQVKETLGAVQGGVDVI